jgi:aspartyl/asparaginyl beta-hydroxylase (cupin superfamily)
MRVGEEIIQWEEGKCLLFDDSFVHSVWHKGENNSGDRIVLLIDLWHPQLQEIEKEAMCYCLAAEGENNQ